MSHMSCLAWQPADMEHQNGSLVAKSTHTQQLGTNLRETSKK